ncbi:MAG: RlmE family RNA methyltransferase [Candidatus Peregrinibacteria bacterium]
MPKAYSPQDKYFHLAKKLGYRARSAFKLEEILDKYPFLLPVHGNIVDLGSAPGSFLQILQERQKRGKLCGVDLKPIEPFSKTNPQYFQCFVGDVFADETLKEVLHFLGTERVDFITSDLAPNTSGVRDIDQWKSIELNERVLEVAEKILKPGGHLITKIFQGEDFQEFWVESFRSRFQTAKVFKPQACRDRSFEVFLIGMGWKPLPKQKDAPANFSTTPMVPHTPDAPWCPFE